MIAVLGPAGQRVDIGHGVDVGRVVGGIALFVFFLALVVVSALLAMRGPRFQRLWARCPGRVPWAFLGGGCLLVALGPPGAFVGGLLYVAVAVVCVGLGAGLRLANVSDQRARRRVGGEPAGPPSEPGAQAARPARQHMARVNVENECWKAFRLEAVRTNTSIAAYLGLLVRREVERVR